MKIHSLRFKNLNSLCGTWTIDFSVPEYRDGGLFAITGPTGSGKSTILDAICLALYGRTPRLDRVNKSGNEIMSRHTGECFAEVTFETADGVFTVHWSQRRARKKPDGALQDPKHEIAHANGELIESKLSATREEVEGRTGMDFDRFTRTMLLAQGGFAAFLNADADERSPILEQITGTGIYSTISMKVHELLRNERDRLAALNTELDGITLLTGEEIAHIHEEIKAAEQNAATQTKELNDLRKGLEWYTAIETLAQKLAESERNATEARKAREAFTSDDARLQAALNAAELEGEFSVLESKRAEQLADTAVLKEIETDLPKRKVELQQLTTLRNTAASAVNEIKARQTLQVPLLRQVRELDTERSRMEKERSETAAECSRYKESLRLAQEELLRLSEEKKKLDESLRKGIAWREEHSADETLTGKSAVINDRIGQCISLEKKQTLIEKEYAIITSDVAKAGAHLQKCGEDLAAAEKCEKEAIELLERKRLEQTALLAGKTLPEYRTKRDSLVKEQYYIVKIRSLEEERKLLADGKPCPLCGAKEHPYARAALPELNEVGAQLSAVERVLEKVEVLAEEIEDTRKLCRRCGDDVSQAQLAQAKADGDVRSVEKVLGAKQNEKEEVKKQAGELRQILISQLAPFGIALPEPGREEELSETITRRADVWKRAQEKLQKLEKDFPEIEKSCALAEQKKDAVSEQCRTLNDRLRKLDGEIAALFRKRGELFGDRNPDAVEKKDAESLDYAEGDLKIQSELLSEVEKKLSELSVKESDLKGRITHAEETIKKKEKAFLSRCNAAGFASVAQFSSAHIPQPERERLRKEKEQCTMACARADALVRHQADALQLEQAKNVTEIPRELLMTMSEKCEEQIRTLRELTGGKRQELAADKENRAKIEGKQDLLTAQQKECDRWERLHALIGSADGKKYRNFAQGITFEYLLAYANRQLVNLSDRYLLTTNRKSPLELFVVDNYQAGEVRTARNLSGGESFLISLALALGLSSMAGRTIRVDSLFLDEGFGTLDEDALETALETLAALRHNGKCIGVISHIAALKERIPTRISVTPVSGGKSELSGPGCFKNPA